MNLKISRDGQMTVTIPASGEGKDTEVPMTYTMNKESKTISIQQDDAENCRKVGWTVYNRDFEKCSTIHRNDI